MFLRIAVKLFTLPLASITCERNNHWEFEDYYAKFKVNWKKIFFKQHNIHRENVMEAEKEEVDESEFDSDFAEKN